METLLHTVEFFSSDNLANLAADPRALFLGAVALVVALLFRQKMVLLFLFAIGGMLAVLRYTRLSDSGGGSVDPSTFVFAGGTLAVAVVIIYFLFIRE